MSLTIARFSFRLAAALLCAASAVGCASDPPPAAGTPSSAPAATSTAVPSTTSSASPAATPDACSEIAGFCHMHDSKGAAGAGAALIHECHELGHAHKLEACVARKQACLDACAEHAH
jgi:hypothetical protein